MIDKGTSFPGRNFKTKQKKSLHGIFSVCMFTQANFQWTALSNGWISIENVTGSHCYMSCLWGLDLFLAILLAVFKLWDSDETLLA